MVREARSFFHSRPLLSYLVWVKYIMSHCHSLCQSDYIEMKKWLQNDCIGGQNALDF